MTSEMLSKILIVEKATAVAESDAKIKAEKNLNDAKLKADSIVANAQQNAREYATNSMLKAKEKAAEIKKTAADAAKVEGSRIIDQARKKQPEAVTALRNHLVPNAGI